MPSYLGKCVFIFFCFLLFIHKEKSSTQMFSCDIKQHVLFPTMLEIGCLYCRYTTGVTKTLEV